MHDNVIEVEASIMVEQRIHEALTINTLGMMDRPERINQTDIDTIISSDRVDNRIDMHSERP